MLWKRYAVIEAADDAQVNKISREANGEELVTVGKVDGGNFSFSRTANRSDTFPVRRRSKKTPTLYDLCENYL